MDYLLPLTVFIAVSTLLALVQLARWSLVFARPDEWLLRIRDGKLLAAGVGIYVWRRPGDVLARFSSTLQRVKFAGEALSADRLPVRLEGFILWSVAAGGDKPLRAFSKLGIANLDSHPTGLRSEKHLLTSNQHKAFQALLGAEIQQVASTLRLADLLAGPAVLLPPFKERLAAIAERLGLVMEQVEVVGALPADATLLQDLSVEEEQRVRSEAAQVRLAAAERNRLAELEARRISQLREDEIARARGLALEETEARLQQARQAREEQALAERLARMQREAEAQAQASRLLTAAEAEKTPEVRAHELSRLMTEKMAAALAALPLREARWVSVGNDSPATSIGALLAGVSDLVTRPPRAS